MVIKKKNSIADFFITMLEEHERAMRNMSPGELLHYVFSFKINLEYAKGNIPYEEWLKIHRELSKYH